MTRGRIVFAAMGSYGDVHPFMAVALEMQARGWSPILLAAAEYVDKARAAGLDFAPMPPSAAEVMERSGGPAELLKHLGEDEYLIRTHLVPAAEGACAAVLPHAREARLVVANHLAFGAHLAAELAGAPLALLAMQPMVFLSAYDPPVVEKAPYLPAIRRTLGPWTVRQLLKLGAAAQRPLWKPLTELRAKLGLPAARGVGLEVPNARAQVALWSPLLGGLQPDHPPATVIAGSLIYEDDPELGDEAPLNAFLDGGPAPVVLTLGSFAGQAESDYFRTGIAAARRLGLRAVVVGGPRALESLQALAAPDVFVAGYAAYSRLFPRARVVVHHGGIGTAQQALRAGVPQLVVPQFGDQPDNARRLRALGVTRAVPFKRYTETAAQAALATLLAPEIAERAADLGRMAASERGAERAADALEKAAAQRA